MSAQACTVCRETGHNARACPSRMAGPLLAREFRDDYELSPTDPMVLALAAHGWGCGICRSGLERHEAEPGAIRVFRDLCGEGQRIVRDTRFAGESAP